MKYDKENIKQHMRNLFVKFPRIYAALTKKLTPKEARERVVLKRYLLYGGDIDDSIGVLDNGCK